MAKYIVNDNNQVVQAFCEDEHYLAVEAADDDECLECGYTWIEHGRLDSVVSPYRIIEALEALDALERV